MRQRLRGHALAGVGTDEVAGPIRFDIELRAKEGTRPELLEKLKIAAERCCVVQQTLRNPPRVQTIFSE